MVAPLLIKWKTLQRAIAHPGVKPSDGIVLARFLDHLNNTTGQLNPSYQTIADATGLSRDTVMTSVRNLEAIGIISVDRTVEPGGHAAKGQRLPSNNFTVNFDPTSWSESSTTPSRKIRPPQSEISTTLAENFGHPQSKKPAGGSRKIRPKPGKEETGKEETGNGREAPAGAQLALLQDPMSSGGEKANISKGDGNKRKRPAKTELPDDWVLSDSQWNYGARLGLTGPQIDTAQRKLKRWVKRERKLSADWGAFAEDWLERELAFLRKNGSAGTIDDRSGFDDYVNAGIRNHG